MVVKNMRDLLNYVEEQMKERIDDFLDHKFEYEARRELSNKAAQSFYNSMGQYKGYMRSLISCSVCEVNLVT